MDCSSIAAPVRRPGRPRGPIVVRATPRPVRLETEVDDAMCRLALQHGVSIHALLRLAARMLVEVPTEVLVRRLP